MSEKKKEFNAVMYLYGELYKQQYGSPNCKGQYVTETWKIYKSTGILNWLKKNNHIFDYSITNLDTNRSVLSYTFNRNNLTYPYYLKYIDKNFLVNSTQVEPMGTIVDEKKVDALASPEKPYTERVSREDSTTTELNSKIKEDLETAA